MATFSAQRTFALLRASTRHGVAVRSWLRRLSSTRTSPTVLTSGQIRQTFLEFFTKKHNHLYVPSSSVIPQDDPSLLFVNAGMNQFKPIFLGTYHSKSKLLSYKRVANTQKCVRAGGKHNDLDDVGKDTYHHTFFEMLGSWSFGDYKKEQAIRLAWELLVDVYGLPKDRLYVTYFGGCPGSDVAADMETKQIWLDVGMPEERVMPFGMKDNFWEMGATGPCGPCSEIHFDRIGGRDASHLVNADDPEVVEIWNLVFLQFNRKDNGLLHQLNKLHVDTGMGLERLVSILQNKRSNYDTDLFVPILDKISEFTGVRPYSGKVGKEDSDLIDTSYRVVADHIRTLVVTISDGERPGSRSQSFIVRRLLRRAMLILTERLKATESLASLVPVVVDSLGDTFPEMRTNMTAVMDAIRGEEVAFHNALLHGRRAFKRAASRIKDGVVPGEMAYMLHDNYGFPLDLILLLAEKHGWTVDLESFSSANKRHQEKSRLAAQRKADSKPTLTAAAIAELCAAGVQKTDDTFKYGYSLNENDAYAFQTVRSSVTALKVGDSFVNKICTGEKASVILDKTCFYAEEGGQEGDRGIMLAQNDMDMDVLFRVDDTQVAGGFVLHHGVALVDFDVGDQVKLVINEERRRKLMANHTATHLLNEALREELGTTEQKGSLITASRLVFDFAATGQLTHEQIQSCEQRVRSRIASNHELFVNETQFVHVTKIKGLRYFAGQIYPEDVRVVSVGTPIECLRAEDFSAGLKTSVELCCGTHLHRSGHIGQFVIVTEESHRTSVRRIVALTGEDAKQAIRNSSMLEKRLLSLVDDVNGSESDMESAQLSGFIERQKLIGKDMELLKLPLVERHSIQATLDQVRQNLNSRQKKAVKELRAACDRYLEKVTHSNPEKFFIEVLQGPAEPTQHLHHFKDVPVLLLAVSNDSERISYVCAIPKDLAATGLKADEWIRCLTSILDGKDGGDSFFARGRTTRYCSQENIQLAIEGARKYAEQFLESPTRA